MRFNSSLAINGLNLYSLSAFHTFHLPARAESFEICSTSNEIISAVKRSCSCGPFIVLGEGSNTVFTSDYHGSVLCIRSKGVRIRENGDAYLLNVAAGESWQTLVELCMQKGLFGLENLALIPGTVGAAPVQNIGAYGKEFAEYCERVYCCDIETGTEFSLSKDECKFGYRDSVFKNELLHKCVITEVEINLPKKWIAEVNYGELTSLTDITAQNVYESVMRTRRSKLPDVNQLGNAGSFFKNPIVSKNVAEAILNVDCSAPIYSVTSKVHAAKISAAWLIDKCGLKGFSVGDAAVHKNHALVLINRGNAKGQDLLELAAIIRQRVFERFSVLLEPEVRLMGLQAEIQLPGIS